MVYKCDIYIPVYIYRYIGNATYIYRYIYIYISIYVHFVGYTACNYHSGGRGQGVDAAGDFLRGGGGGPNKN